MYSLSNPRKLVRANWSLTGVVASPFGTLQDYKFLLEILTSTTEILQYTQLRLYTLKYSNIFEEIKITLYNNAVEFSFPHKRPQHYMLISLLIK